MLGDGQGITEVVEPAIDIPTAQSNVRAFAAAQEKFLTGSGGSGMLLVKFVGWRAVWVTGISGDEGKAIDSRGRLRDPE